MSASVALTQQKELAALVPDSFLGELNRQCARVSLGASIIALFTWLPYIELDRHLHPSLPGLQFWRLGLSLVGALGVITYLIPNFPMRGLTIILVLGTYLEIATAVITGLTGGDAPYMGGFCLTLMLVPLGPIPKIAAWVIICAALAAFGTVIGLTGWDLSSHAQKYSAQNVAVSGFLSAFFVYITDKLRMRSWKNLNESRNEARRAEELNRLLKSVNENSDLPAVMNRISQYVKSRYGLPYSCLFQADTNQGLLHFAYALLPESVSAEDREFFENITFRADGRTEDSIHAISIRERRPFFTRNIADERRQRVDDQLSQALFQRSLITLPIFLEKHLIATMDFYSTHEVELSEAQMTELALLAEQLAGIINSSLLLLRVREAHLATEEAKRYAEVEGKLAEMARAEAEQARLETHSLNQLVRKLNENLDLGLITQTLHEYVRENFKIQYFALYGVDEPGENLYQMYISFPEYTTSEDRKIFSKFRIPLKNVRGAHAFTVKAQRPWFLRKIKRQGVTPEELFAIEKLRMESFLMIPLVLQGQPVGVLDFWNDGKLNLNDADIARLSILGEQLAGIIYGSNLFQQVRVERERSETLLKNILPATIAAELKETSVVVPKYFDSASVLFTDFVGFTRISEKLSPADLVTELDGCFSQFDEVVRRNNLEKLKTIGDAYMCAAGLPEKNPGHAIDACLTALELGAFMRQMAEIKNSIGVDFWKIRIGIHSGPVTAGVIGTNKFAYDIWGDTVNTASRMESSGSPDKINVSAITYELARDFFDFEYRGEIEAKGKGKLGMYYLLGIKPGLSLDGEGRIPNRNFLELRAQRNAFTAAAGNLN